MGNQKLLEALSQVVTRIPESSCGVGIVGGQKCLRRLYSPGKDEFDSGSTNSRWGLSVGLGAGVIRFPP